MFRKILITFLILLFSSPLYATDYFLDLSHDQANGGDGTTMETDGGADDAFKTFAEAVGSIGSGDTCWIRRVRTETQSADVQMSQSGTANSPAIWIGWPRDAHSWNADFTNGSTTVDNIDENDADREQHQGRWLTGPDGYDYLITDITDSNTVIIDRPYAGSTAANEDVSIKADELPQGVSEPTDTDGWSADADDLALIDFDDNNNNVFTAYKHHIQFWNLEMIDSTDSNGVIGGYATGILLHGCLVAQLSGNNARAVKIINGAFVVDRCIIEGSGAGSVQIGIDSSSAFVTVLNSAIYNMGNHGINVRIGYFENVNVGVEVANGDDDIEVFFSSSGRDVKLGGTNGEYIFYTAYSSSPHSQFYIVNYNKVLNAFKGWFYNGGVVEKVAVTSTNANKKLSDNVIEITPETVATYQQKELNNKQKIWESRKTYSAGTYNVKLWIYNDTGGVLNDTTFSDDILMRCRAEAGNYGDATTEYVSMPWTYSDEIDIADAADADDWDYLQCDSVVVDQTSKIYCEVLVSTYDAEADVILIDPSTTNP